MTIEKYLKNKKILIFGLGKQGGGVGDANYLATHNYRVRATDQKTKDALGLKPGMLDPRIELSLGEHKKTDFDWADLIIKNPGVADDHPLILYAKSKNLPVVSAISLYVSYSKVPTIAVTGTRGKTTTTSLIFHILNLAFPGQIVLGGNLPGTSGLSLFDQDQNAKYVVLELSSFQLASFHDSAISPTYAIVTNLYPDHLNRYMDMAHYQYDKTAIVAYLKEPGFVVYNQENEGSVDIVKQAQVKKYGYTSKQAEGYDTTLLGVHNQSNIAAAITLSQLLKIPDSLIRQGISTFKGVPYRQEVVAVKHGVTYINDTTATTPVASIVALRVQLKPTILICGGESKKLPHNDLVQEITDNKHVKKVIILGSSNLVDFTDKLIKTSNKVAGQVFSMQEALDMATQLSEPGDVVLLSPGFFSFDLFDNEFDRGDQFNHCVSKL